MGTSSAPESTPTKKPSNAVPAIFTLAGFALAIVAGFLSWFVISGSSYPLVTAAYNAMYIYGTKGSAALGSLNSLGAMLVAQSTAHPEVLLAYAIVLFFWPAMVVSGLWSLIVRSFGPYPFIWGLIAFVFAYVMVYYAGAALGIGAFLALVGAVLYLIGTATVRRPAKSVPASTPDPNAASGAAPPS
jgi:hypothetical protein